MLEMNEQWGDMEPHWMPYFQVADCDAVAQKAGELGGNLLHGPDDIPNVGRFALIQDGQGARFYVIKLTMPL
jgi:predicted enzyme related to lactoylglutathione lyase